MTDVEKLSQILYQWVSSVETYVAMQLARLIESADGATIDEYHALEFVRLMLIRKSLAKYLNITTPRITKLAREAVEAAKRSGKMAALEELAAEFEQPVKMRYTDTTLPLRIWAFEGANLGNVLHSIGLIMHRQSLDIFRKYGDLVGFAVASGTMSVQTAAKQLAGLLARDGVLTFFDRSGREWDMFAYCDMVARTTAARAHVQGFVEQLADRGHDLVIVSDSPHECELCRPWEMRVLSLSGTSKEYPSVADATANGLFHPNCTHRLHAYFPGVTEISKTPTEDVQGYELQKEQRRLERKKRRLKLALSAAPGDPKIIAKIAETNKSLDELVKISGERRKTWRESPLPTQLKGFKAPFKMPRLPA